MLALKVENISKQYRLGEVGTGSLAHDLNRFWHKIRGKEDPYLKIGESNDRTTKGSSDYVWSLRDINFEIEQGDAVGIIGRNGAGKSTLLKLLSKVTKPTTGNIYTNGRIASLLEVGTGFHPEMTGRENIYLNGAILGMTRREIKRKFDEIVDFSGVERYIDTPVKRYSSGMYVRLAFAVAAHLESEILIVDEVLAVGDAEFQKKCLGKMGDVSKGEGRTVLFVSHNMAAVKELCNSGVLLNHGNIIYQGGILDTVFEYQKIFSSTKNYSSATSDIEIGNSNLKIVKFEVAPSQGAILGISSGVKISISFENYVENQNIDLSYVLKNIDEVEIFAEGVVITDNYNSEKRIYNLDINIPPNILNEGNYYLKLIFGKNRKDLLFSYDKFGFEILGESLNGIFSRNPGIIRPQTTYKIY